jgi:hypothetical protein
MYVIRDTTSECDLSVEKPELKTGMGYYYADTGTITFDDITSWSFDTSTRVLTINGTDYAASTVITHSLAVNSYTAYKNVGSLEITLTRDDDISVTPIYNDDLDSTTLTLLAGTHTLTFDTIGTFKLASDNYISNSIFITIENMPLTPRANFVTVT